MKKPAAKLIILFAVCAIILYAAEEGILDGFRKYPHSGQYGLSGAKTVTGGNTPFGGNAESGDYANPDYHAVSEQNAVSDNNSDVEAAALIDPAGKTVPERIGTPDGYERIKIEQGSFGDYLRNLPLKPAGSKVIYYNGEIKPNDVQVAVIDLDVGKRDLQQCADSVIRMRAEYLYGKGLYDNIRFNFTNGFEADYSNWIKGNRISVSGSKVSWVSGRGSAGTGYDSFRSYLDMVFAYAGTLSLSKEMRNIPIEDMEPGDVFIKGATPGHCVIVLDMAYNRDTGKKCYIIAQGYMPAQDIHILKNPANADDNPWYDLSSDEEIATPEWTFTKDQLYRFID